MNMIILAIIIWIGVGICGLHYYITENRGKIANHMRYKNM